MANQDIPILGPILNRIIGTRNDRFVKRYLQRVDAINALEPAVRVKTDAQIREHLEVLRAKIDQGVKPVDIMVEAFAHAREAMDRSVGIRNIFNPAKNFDPAPLPPEARALYDETKARIDAAEPKPPTGEFLGCTEPQPAWLWVEIPPALYEAVRALYPESRPPFRARPFDVQLIGAMVLSQGKIAEMRTGEGKTIVGPLATYLAAVERIKVHVVTVNDYLVQRDRDWTYPFFHALGLTVGAIHPQHMQDEYVKRQMYRCDVVYGTTSEFGFDYLRDNMKRTAEQQVQKRREFAIVDEVDSILIDEARTPLIISGPAHEGAPRYDLANRLAMHLVEKQKPWQKADDKVESTKRLIKGLEGDIRNTRDKDKIPALQERLKQAKAELPGLEAAKTKFTQYYETQMERKTCFLTHDGIAEAQRVAGAGSFYVGENTDLPHLLEQALRAHVVYQLDRDYIVAPSEDPMTGRMEPSIIIVDVNTGRPMKGRQWSDGLHQACEAKEGVPIKQETQTVATITVQNFFKMYKRLAGMTGTADTEAQEFHDIYKLDVVTIPTNKPVTRRDFDDVIFLTGKDKWDFIVDEIHAFHDAGRPVLVGTTSVEKSEMLSNMLTRKHGIQHEVLNAKQHEREAHIIENAGQLGAVMIATNMAGRGTDIKLGPVTRETLLDHWLRRGIVSRNITTASSVEEIRESMYRKVAPAELGIPKRDAETKPLAELELMLLRHWATRHTDAAPKAIERMNADELRAELDQWGRFRLHNIRWVDTIEDLGGLHVVGTERHDSRRIDNQLRGRSGRQGDKGSSRFFIALDDDMIKHMAGETLTKAFALLGMKEGDKVEAPMISKSVERAQRKIEEINFQRRKQILEYDEVMEHQRRIFYGLRQRVLEGRDMKGLIFGYIRDASADAVTHYLDPEYAATCAAEAAHRALDWPVPAARLRGLDVHEMEKRIRANAKEEARAMIDMTIGEYIPDIGAEPQTDSEGNVISAVDVDIAGLVNWARNRFGVELSPEELAKLSETSRTEIARKLNDAADEKIDRTDLSSLVDYTAKDYGARALSAWIRTTFEITIEPEIIAKAAVGPDGHAAVTKLITDETEKLYRTREIEYPVDFALQMAMNRMRQVGIAAMTDLVNWANTRYQLGWTEDSLKTRPPAVARQELLAAATAFVDEGKLEKEVQAAIAQPTDQALEAHLQARFKIPLPEHLRRLVGEERSDAIRSLVEAILRGELVYLERTMLLEILDDTWKGHLYAMDQLRDTIGFRSFSQLDPRIEYKREGSRMFADMMQSIRDKITEYIFKTRFQTNPQPAAAPIQASPARPPMAPAANAASRQAASFGTTIAGPGFTPPSPPTNQA